MLSKNLKILYSFIVIFFLAFLSVSAALGETTSTDELIEVIREKGRVEQSSSVLIMHKNKTLVEEYYGHENKPICAMSIAKSVTALAIAHLVDSGKLDLDWSLNKIIKNWPGGDYSLITVRHLMNHTSGLSTKRAHWNSGLMEHAIKTELVTKPGSAFKYNNNAVDILGSLFKPLTGVFMDEYLERNLFDAMGIKDSSWLKYTDGHPKAAGDLFLYPADLAKLGQLMLNKGMWDGKPLVSRLMAEALPAVSQQLINECGLLWWRVHNFTSTLTQKTLETWIEKGFSQDAALAASAILEKTFISYDEYKIALFDAVPRQEFTKLNGKFVSGELKWVDKIPGPLLGYAGRGWLGQYLVVIPESDLVAVRMRSKKPEDYNQQGEPGNTYPDFENDILKLAQSLKVIP